MQLSEATKDILHRYAERYESDDFIIGDPSWFMHQVTGDNNQETMAFIAAALSYGSRKQFLPKIENFLIWSEGEPYSWIKNGLYTEYINKDNHCCYYRLYDNHEMWVFLDRYRQLLNNAGNLKKYVKDNASDHQALTAIDCLCKWFAVSGTMVIPKDNRSACKRLCMFLRWMVRDNSPVDLGLWSDIINKTSLIIPLDTHVLTEASELNLIHSKNATMSTALKLTDTLRQIFPDDPTKGDFALFGYGVNK